ncbi:MAG TPA: division/cell wall cluster transcriptional repressor MraZ [Anaerolineales bacterium]
MFLGKYARTLDARNRISVPPSFKAELTGGAYMTQGFDRNVQVLTTKAFQEVYRQATSLNVADPVARLLLRLFLGNAIELPAAKMGIVIPDNLKEYAGLRENVLLIGQGEYFEIWAPELWSQQETAMKDAEANADRFAGLTIGTRAGTSS